MKKIFNALMSKRVSNAYTAAMIGGYVLMFASGEAAADVSLRQTGVTIFNTLYSIVGIVGGIALVAQILNWKLGNFFGTQDPKKAIMQTLGATALGFAVVGIIQAIKMAVAANGADIGSV